jgi:hypothetical protein
VAKAGQWLFTTTDYTLEASDIRQGVGEPYPAPRQIRIRARGSGFLLEAEYRALVLYNITDVLEEVPRFLRPVVALFAKRPVYLRFLGSLEGTVIFPDGRKEPIRLSGPFEYVIVR